MSPATTTRTNKAFRALGRLPDKAFSYKYYSLS